MNNITNISDHKPHLMIPDISGDAHIIPVSLIEDVISGKKCITQIEEWQYILPTILKEWLNNHG